MNAPASDEANKTLTTVIYALYASSILVGVTILVAIVMNYVKRDDVAGTWLESHFPAGRSAPSGSGCCGACSVC